MNRTAGVVGRSIAVLVALSVVASGTAVAQAAWADDAYLELEGMVDEYNANVGATDLGVAGDQLRNERTTLVVTDADGSTLTASFRLDDRLRMTELARGERDDATLRMSTDRVTMTGIVDSPTPAAAFRDAVTSGDVDIDGLGLGNAVKWVVLDAVLSVGRLIGLF